MRSPPEMHGIWSPLLPTGEVIQHPFKDFGYQIYFQDPQSTVDIHAQVCSALISPVNL
jgi:hypothetical protein